VGDVDYSRGYVDDSTDRSLGMTSRSMGKLTFG